MPTIQFEHVSFHHADPHAEVFRDVSLAIDTSWRTGVIGRNGRGKTTLLRLVTGELTPTSGSVRTPARCVRLASPRPDATATRTVIRNQIAPFDRWERDMDRLLSDGSEPALGRYAELLDAYRSAAGFEIDALIERELALVGVDPTVLERSFESLSGGQRTRTMIAALFLTRNAYPLLDEPTNHLDIAGRSMLAEYLASRRGFMLVSHDRDLLDRAVDHVVSLERTGAHVVAGTYTTWKLEHDRLEDAERHRNEILQREIASLERAARQRRTWSDAKEKTKQGARDKGFVGRRAAKQMKRALCIEARVEASIDEKRGLLKNVESVRSLRIESNDGAETPLCALEHATVAFGDLVVVEGFSLSIRRGERVALIGANGCGKTSVLRALTGELALRSGRAWLPSRLRVGRSYQHPCWAGGFLRDHLRSAAVDETHFRHLLGAVGVVGDIFERPLETFSEGERKKVDLCRSLATPADLYIWDEPVNYVDVISREQIERAIIEHAPTLLFVEHDRRFVDAVATRVVEMGRLRGGAMV